MSKVNESLNTAYRKGEFLIGLIFALALLTLATIAFFNGYTLGGSILLVFGVAGVLVGRGVLKNKFQ